MHARGGGGRNAPGATKKHTGWGPAEKNIVEDRNPNGGEVETYRRRGGTEKHISK